MGGAVPTKAYAEQIGADFYAKDAKASADYAKQIFWLIESSFDFHVSAGILL